MTFRVEVEQETDGRWIAEIIELPGAMTYGVSRDEAVSKIQVLALRAVADRLEHVRKVPVLAHADRPPRTRIISARTPTRREQQSYEEES